eukprot:6178559-Pleurochrysis_carterae.AAC.1
MSLTGLVVHTQRILRSQTKFCKDRQSTLIQFGTPAETMINAEAPALPSQFLLKQAGLRVMRSTFRTSKPCMRRQANVHVVQNVLRCVKYSIPPISPPSPAVCWANVAKS